MTVNREKKEVFPLPALIQAILVAAAFQPILQITLRGAFCKLNGLIA